MHARSAAQVELQPRLIDTLCALVLGNVSPPPPAGAAPPPPHPDEIRRPASVAIRLKALAQLNRSVGAASRFPAVLQATFHAIFGGDATPKLQQAGCQLALWIGTHGAQPLLEPCC